VEYLKPVNVRSEIVVEGRETEQKGRNLFMTGEIRDEAGEVLLTEQHRREVQAARGDLRWTRRR